MTEFFEVVERDGPARRGELRLDQCLITPAVADDVLVDAGDLWSADRDVPEGDSDEVTILPHRGFPPGTADEVVDAFAPSYPDVSYPSAAVIDPRTADDHGADVYILSTAQGVVGHASAFREAIKRVRAGIPDDTGLCLSGVATPANVALLAWAGVDLVDATRAKIAGSRGQYLTPSGSYGLDDLTELPCPCPACARSVDEFDRAACIDHNVATLRAELATVRQRIRDGRLRELLGGRCRHTAWVAAALRESEAHPGYLEERTPVFRRSDILASSDDVLNRVEITRYADRLAERYECRFRRPAVLLPCSARKPYSESQSHRQFRDVIQYRAHRVAISSPIGVVPQELECTYPAQHYDTPVTGRWSPNEVTLIGEQLGAFLATHDYPRIIAHMPPGGYREVVEHAVGVADVDVTYTVEDHPTVEASLSNLAAALDGELAYSRYDRRQHTIRAIADYQFGPGAAAALFPSFDVEAPYPKHRVLGPDGAHLATMVPEYGLLALTLAGARQWVAADLEVRRVTIDDFVPHGDVLAPGILDASADIRVGDEVVVEGPSAFGIGRACMHGRAMVESTRGVAVDLRHSEEL